jgi:nitrite reductase (NADH) small subunit
MQTQEGGPGVSKIGWAILLNMPYVKVGTVSAMPPESATEVMIGHQPYAICNTGGSISALNGICLHRGGPLGQGQIENGHIVCPYHMWAFNCRTGAYDYNPALAVCTYPVKVEGDDILIEVP